MTADLCWEYLAQRYEPLTQRWATPGDLAKALDPRTVQTPALDLIDEALIDVTQGRCDRLIITMPPQEGKSSRVTKIGALWFLLHNPDWRVAIVSYAQDLANDFGRDIRTAITGHSGQEDTLDLGLRIAPDSGAVSSWQIDGHRGGVRSVGITGGLTGRAANCLIIDDPVANRERADSPVYREQAKNFWRTVGSTRLAPGAPVILVLTRWHTDDLAGYLLGQEDAHRWRVINIPAQADHDPNKGGTDLLGRQPGEWMASARVNEDTGQQRTPAQWEQIRVQTGTRDFTALYQGRPSPETGGVLQEDWWHSYDQPLWLEHNGVCMVPNANGADVELCQSWDFTFKDTKSSDFVVGQVWLRRGADVFLLDQVRARMSFTGSLKAIRALSKRWPQATAKLVEDKANGPAILNALRSQLVGLIPVEPEGSKYARAAAVSPLVEAGNVHLPDVSFAPWVSGLVQEAKDFPNVANDDQVDALSQALHRLLLVPMLDGTLIESDDLLDDEDVYSISPY